MQLFDKYRPKALADLVGHDETVNRLQKWLDRGADRGAIWIEGSSGIGKTSLARALANDFGAERGNIFELDGDKFDSATRKDLDSRLGYVSMYGRRVFIVNEAHCVDKRGVNWLLTALERLNSGDLWIFTTTEKLGADLYGEFSAPLASRCRLVKLSNQGLADLFTDHVMEILDVEGLGGAPRDKVKRAVQDAKNNMRAVLQRAEFGDFEAA